MVNRRKEARHIARLPVEIDGKRGTTLNLSSTGVAFESAIELKFGQDVTICILVDKGGPEPVRLTCRGKIVRLEKTRRIENGRETVSVGASIDWITDDPTATRELFEILSDDSNIDGPPEPPPEEKK